MKEIVIVSKIKEYIKQIESDLQQHRNKEICLMESVFGEESKLGIAFYDKVNVSLLFKNPLKNALKIYKQKYFCKKCNQNVTQEVIFQFTKLNLEEESYFVFQKLNFKGKIFLDSVFEFYTKEIKQSWDRVCELLNENSLVFNDKKLTNSLLKFDKENPKK